MPRSNKPWEQDVDHNAGYLIEDSSDEYDTDGEGMDISAFERELEKIEKNAKASAKREHSSEDEGKEDEQKGGKGAKVTFSEGTAGGNAKEKGVVGGGEGAKSDNEYYEEDYFSSGEEEEGEGDKMDTGEVTAKRKSQRRKPTNDELLYDPNLDAEDEKWVERQRARDRPRPKLGPDGKPLAQPPTTTDAILSCPLCMNTVCLDCQQHEIYSTQFRAMFVTNCFIVQDEVLRHQAKQKGRKKGKEKSFEGGEDGDTFHPVRCSTCNTEIGVYDKDEVYHFFNVLASEA